MGAKKTTGDAMMHTYRYIYIYALGPAKRCNS